MKEDDFLELRVVRNSPKRMEIKSIKKDVKPTQGFRESIDKAGLFNISF